MKQQIQIFLKFKDGTQASLTLIADAGQYSAGLVRSAQEIVSEHLECFVAGKILHTCGPMEVPA